MTLVVQMTPPLVSFNVAIKQILNQTASGNNNSELITVPRHSITIGTVIGWGTFGVVCKGTYLNHEVAVKSVPLPDIKTKDITLKEAQIHRLVVIC